jgi:multidrug efflux pump subunit AcrB
MNPGSGSHSTGFAGRIAALFIDSKLTPIATLASIILGFSAVVLLPREEEPQISVPMVDLLVSLPGSSAAETENRVTRPLEKLMWEVRGVEYVYSTSSPGRALVTVRFHVGTKIEDALVRLHRQLQGNAGQLPPGASQPIVRARTIDDVPVLALTLHSRVYDGAMLRRVAAQLEEVVKSVPDVAETTIIGGNPRALRVQLNAAALAAHEVSPVELAAAVQAANRKTQSGSLPLANREVLVETGQFLRGADDLRNLDGGDEPSSHVLHGERGTSGWDFAVTLTVAKRPGANAVDVVHRILAKVASLRGTLLPAEVSVTVTRDYGETAAEKSNELLLHMGIAVFGVAMLILLFLGWRESVVVLLAIPSTLGLTLMVFYLYGYTLNRITLFALIFSIGILVDDAIVVVENLVRHFRMPASTAENRYVVAVRAVDEVGNPTVLATWAVIAAILPMAFVGGLMGPYMRPIPIGSTAAMLFSLGIAFTITPWAAVRLLAGRGPASDGSQHAAHPADWSTRLYYRIMEPLLSRAAWRWAFFASIGLAMIAALGLLGLGLVQVKMLPFDNKSEFQIVINTPEGTTLEQTLRVAQEMADAAKAQPEVRDLQVYAGIAAPFNFSGLVRHYFLRTGANVADIQVNLVPVAQRDDQSHEIAKRIRREIVPIAARHGAAVAVAEVPPGPPVLQSIVAEIYAPDESARVAYAERVRSAMARTRGVVDIDWFVEERQPRIHFVVDREKAALHGISESTIVRVLNMAAQGEVVDVLHLDAEREVVPIKFELDRAMRGAPGNLTSLRLRGERDPRSPLVPLSEFVRIDHGQGERSLFRKNLKAVTYVTGDVADEVESPAYAMFAVNRALQEESNGDVPVYHLNSPPDDLSLALKWDGEWHITLEVFRDLGLAFAAVLVLIAMLMVGWFKSYVTPLVVMAAIPFSLIGILPAHAALGAFFTATSMIGFMAGAGIVVRNSIILVDFIELRRQQGEPLREAVIEAGAVRFRPMLLTALAVVVGASVILKDPIFQGLAISLLFGEIASLFVSRLAVPVLYYMTNSTALQR